MKRIPLILLILLIGLILCFLVYRKWFFNPYQEKLHIHPEEIYAKDSTDDSLLVRNTSLIDVRTAQVIPKTSILIRGDSIAGIYHDSIPEAMTKVSLYDARGKYVLPGFFDVHVHLATYWHLASGDFSPCDSLVTRAALEQFVRYGVTGILVLGGGGANNDQMVQLKKEQAKREIISPHIMAVGNQFTVAGSHPLSTIMRLPDDVSARRAHQAGVTIISSETDLPALMVRKKKLGLDGVKIIIETGPAPFYPKPRMSKDLAAKVVEAAKAKGLPVYAHAEALSEFADAVSLNIRGTMHSVSDTLISDPDLVNQMLARDIWYVPTLALLYGFQAFENAEQIEDPFIRNGLSQRMLRNLEHPVFRFGIKHMISKYDVEKWLQVGMRNLLFLHSRGVPIALGTDASTPFNFPGSGVHMEMELMQEAGLTPAEILKIATLNSARFLGIDDMLGTLEPGKRANFLLLDKNPLSDIRNTRTIHCVFLRGKPIRDVVSTNLHQPG